MTDRGLDKQKLWYCRWGTMIALVWATTAENAELRVRHQRFDRRLTLEQVTFGAQLVRGDVLVSEATEHDRQVYAEWSEPAVNDEWPLDECGICGSCLCDGDPCQLYGRAGAHQDAERVDDPDWERGRPVPKGAA